MLKSTNLLIKNLSMTSKLETSLIKSTTSVVEHTKTYSILPKMKFASKNEILNFYNELFINSALLNSRDNVKFFSSPVHIFEQFKARDCYKLHNDIITPIEWKLMSTNSLYKYSDNIEFWKKKILSIIKHKEMKYDGSALHILFDINNSNISIDEALSRISYLRNNNTWGWKVRADYTRNIDEYLSLDDKWSQSIMTYKDNPDLFNDTFIRGNAEISGFLDKRVSKYSNCNTREEALEYLVNKYGDSSLLTKQNTLLTDSIEMGFNWLLIPNILFSSVLLIVVLLTIQYCIVNFKIKIKESILPHHIDGYINLGSINSDIITMFINVILFKYNVLPRTKTINIHFNLNCIKEEGLTGLKYSLVSTKGFNSNKQIIEHVKYRINEFLEEYKEWTFNKLILEFKIVLKQKSYERQVY